MRITHKVDYGVRVMAALAASAADEPHRPVSSAVLAATDDLPPGFLDDILRLLRNGNLVRSRARSGRRVGPRPAA